MKDTQNRLTKEFTKTQWGGTEKNAAASSLDVTETLNDDNDNNKHTDYVKWMVSVSVFLSLMQKSSITYTTTTN